MGVLSIGEALAKLQALAHGASMAEAAPELSRVGGALTRSAQLNPNYFTSAARTPTADLAQLMSRYKLDHADDMMGAGTRVLKNGQPASKANVGTVMDSLQAARDKGDIASASSLTKALRSGQLNPQTQLQTIDMLSVAPGSGGAKDLYPPLFESILAEPDSANVAATGLSLPNQKRKSVAMSGALEKFGDLAGDRLRIDPRQITPHGDVNYDSNYHALPTDAKVGMLQALTVPSNVGKVNGSLDYLKMLGHQGAGSGQDASAIDKLMQEARSLGLLDAGWQPSTDVGPDFYPRLSSLVSGISGLKGTPQSVGVDSLRRAGISVDALRGVTAEDLAAQPYLTDQLARRRGGRIPVRPRARGALTATFPGASMQTQAPSSPQPDSTLSALPSVYTAQTPVDPAGPPPAQ